MDQRRASLKSSSVGESRIHSTNRPQQRSSAVSKGQQQTILSPSSSSLGGRSPRTPIGNGGAGGGGAGHNRRSSGIIPLGLAVGARIFLPNTKCFGTVRYLGETQFADDVWVGIELDTAKGKNAGEVQVNESFPFSNIFIM